MPFEDSSLKNGLDSNLGKLCDKIILISLDCARPESLGCYPSSFAWSDYFPYRLSTPHIDEISRDGIRFDKCFCQAPFTPASHATVLSGLNPYQHGIREIFGQKMYEDVELLSEKLQNEGYNTGGFIGAHALNSRYGFSRGFDVYDEDFVDSRKNWALGERRGCEEVTDRALSWLSTNGADEFLFVHYFDAHDGGHLPTFTRERIRETRELVDQVDPRPGYAVDKALDKIDYDPSYGKRYYLRQMNRIDEQIGRLITHLKKSGSYADSLIIIMGDHGDAFGEHGEYNHREYLYDTTLHVPLIVKLPSNALKGSCSQLVRLSDITPTVCSLLDLPVVEMDGKPLLAEQLIEGRPVYAETRIEKSVSEKDNIKNSYVGLRTHRWKLILNQLTDEVELYDVVNDSGERKNMASQNEAIVKRLKNAIDERLSDTPSDKDNRMEQGSQHEMVGRLRSLGYLE